MLKEIIIFSWTNLIHKKVRSWLTLLGVLIGITAVVSLIGLGNSLEGAVTSTFGFLNPDQLIIQASGGGQGPPGTGVVTPLTTKDVDKINSLSTIEIAAGRIIETVKATYNGKNSFGFAASVPDGDKRKLLEKTVRFEALQGRLLKDGDTNKVMVGNDLSKDTNEFGKSILVGSNVEINGKTFEVIGVLEKRGSFTVDSVILFNEQDLRDLNNNPDNVDVILAQAKSKEIVGQAAEQIKKLLRNERNVKEGKEDFSVNTPESALNSVGAIIGGIQAFIVIIAGISIFVGAVGIANTMFTSVVERRKEIGIMKAIGAKNSHIFLLFLFESGLMGTVGGILGTAFGTLLALAGNSAIQSFLGTTAAFVFNWPLIVGAIFGSFLIGAISGIVPALNAANLHPVDAMRQ